jgi:hypothetical protein
MRIPWVVVVGGLSLGLSSGLAWGQIRYLTVRAPKSPMPAMALFPVGPPPVGATPNAVPSAPPKTAIASQSKPSLDKDELEKRVVAFQKQRSEAGSDSAQYELGMRYAQGRGVEKDLGLARQWLKLSAAQGNKEAEAALAKLTSAQ